jgi:hypothetical protein
LRPLFVSNASKASRHAVSGKMPETSGSVLTSPVGQQLEGALPGRRHRRVTAGDGQVFVVDLVKAPGDRLAEEPDLR